MEPQIVDTQINTRGAPPQPPRLVQLRAILDRLPDKTLLSRLHAYRPGAGRPGYPPRAMWRAYVASFVLNLPSTNALVRELEDDHRLRLMCGFRPYDPLPHRRTFNRFIRRLGAHADLIEAMHVDLTNHMKTLLPDMGEVVAIDSTPVRSHSQPRKGTDPEAGWAVANSPQGTHGKKWVWGAKAHLVADAIYGLPLSLIVTRGNRNDTLEMLPLVDKARGMYDWFNPKAAVADRGYDSRTNHEGLWFDRRIIPVMRLRSTPDGPPVCEGGMPMEFRGIDRDKRRVYRCPAEGCPLGSAKPKGRCAGTHRIDPTTDIRRHGVIRRHSKRWDGYYNLRKSIERIFKRMKESRRLERHCIRGLRGLRLHALMSALTLGATVLMNIRAGRMDRMGWMVRQVV